MDQLDRQPTQAAVATALVAAMPDAAVVILDAGLRVTFAAGTPLERVSWRTEEIVGRRLADLLPGAVYGQVAAPA